MNRKHHVGPGSVVIEAVFAGKVNSREKLATDQGRIMPSPPARRGDKNRKH